MRTDNQLIYISYFFLFPLEEEGWCLNNLTCIMLCIYLVKSYVIACTDSICEYANQIEIDKLSD